MCCAKKKVRHRPEKNARGQTLQSFVRAVRRKRSNPPFYYLAIRWATDYSPASTISDWDGMPFNHQDRMRRHIKEIEQPQA